MLELTHYDSVSGFLLQFLSQKTNATHTHTHTWVSKWVTILSVTSRHLELPVDNLSKNRKICGETRRQIEYHKHVFSVIPFVYCERKSSPQNIIACKYIPYKPTCMDLYTSGILHYFIIALHNVILIIDIDRDHSLHLSTFSFRLTVWSACLFTMLLARPARGQGWS